MACGRDRERTMKVIQLPDVKLAKVNKRILDTEDAGKALSSSASETTQQEPMLNVVKPNHTSDEARFNGNTPNPSTGKGIEMTSLILA